MRLQFDVLDLFRASQGIQRPDGYAVIPQDIAEKIEEEFERLYAIEGEATVVVDMLEKGMIPSQEATAMIRLHDLLGNGKPA